MKKPTIEEHELLIDLLFNSDGVKVLMDELERQLVSVEQDLIRSFLLDSEEDDRKFRRLKLEAQGARKLFKNFQTHLEQTRIAALKAASNPS